MNYPAGLPVRAVSFGQAFSLEGGTLLAMKVTIQASRSLLHLPTGSPLIAAKAFFLSDVSGNQVISLPVTDSANMALASTAQPIALEPGQHTHYYTAKIEFLNADTQKPLQGVAPREVGMFTLPTGNGSVIDLDNLYAPLTPDVPITLSLLEQFEEVRDETIQARDEAVSAAAGAVSTASLPELVQDIVGQMMLSGGTLSFAYDDATGKATYTATGIDAEAMRDSLGVALVGTNGITIQPNDGADTIVVSISGLTISQITGLQTALDGKASTTHTHAGTTYTPSYANVLDGSRFTILYGTGWPTSRPSTRTTIYFDLIGGSSAVADPSWMLNGDAREITS